MKRETMVHIKKGTEKAFVTMKNSVISISSSMLLNLAFNPELKSKGFLYGSAATTGLIGGVKTAMDCEKIDDEYEKELWKAKALDRLEASQTEKKDNE